MSMTVEVTEVWITTDAPTASVEVSEVWIEAVSASNILPTANAGSDQTNIEPWTTVTLNGSGSADSDGTIVSYTWRQISGTSVTLSNTASVTCTYTAPGTIAGVTLVFGLVVTDNSGGTSTEDTVSHTILYATERAVIGGAEVPMQIKEVSQ